MAVAFDWNPESSQPYVKEPDPPDGVTVALPSHMLLHDSLTELVEEVNAGGAVILIPLISVHPLASVSVTLYVPAQRLAISSVVSKLLQL